MSLVDAVNTVLYAEEFADVNAHSYSEAINLCLQNMPTHNENASIADIVKWAIGYRASKKGGN